MEVLGWWISEDGSRRVGHWWSTNGDIVIFQILIFSDSAGALVGRQVENCKHPLLKYAPHFWYTLHTYDGRCEKPTLALHSCRIDIPVPCTPWDILWEVLLASTFKVFISHENQNEFLPWVRLGRLRGLHLNTLNAVYFLSTLTNILWIMDGWKVKFLFKMGTFVYFLGRVTRSRIRLFCCKVPFLGETPMGKNFDKNT